MLTLSTISLLQYAVDGPYALIRFLCSPLRSNSTLFPVVAQLERALAFSPSETPAEKLAKLEGFLRKTGFADGEVVALIGHLLALPIGDRYPVPELSPQKRKEKTFAVLLDWLVHLSQQEPLLVVFEDAHWADPTSLEILSLVAARVARLPILLLITARPEFTPSWPSDAHVTSLALTRLGRTDDPLVARERRRAAAGARRASRRRPLRRVQPGRQLAGQQRRGQHGEAVAPHTIR